MRKGGNQKDIGKEQEEEWTQNMCSLYACIWHGQGFVLGTLWGVEKSSRIKATNRGRTRERTHKKIGKDAVKVKNRRTESKKRKR